MPAPIPIPIFNKLRTHSNPIKQEILPCLERRISNLSRHVADARKGVKNVLKSFWRKPREDSPSRAGSNGTVRYRFDRIEAQILLLADTCFIIKVVYCMYVFFFFFLKFVFLLVFLFVRHMCLRLLFILFYFNISLSNSVPLITILVILL